MIPIFKPPQITNEEFEKIKEVLNSGWIGLGPKTEEFENLFSKYLGGNTYCIAVNSCTAALHIGLISVGIKEGDEVITTPITFASTTEAILYVGGTPVFGDIEYGTLNLDPTDVEKRITSKTKAIIPVHYGGHPCDMKRLNEIAKKYNLIIIEDAAHACGSEMGGKKIGDSENMCCFSFHAVKNLAVGDGGMITTKSKEIHDRLKKLRWMGINKDTFLRNQKRYSWDYNVEEQGFKYHMNDISAIIGIIQLKKLEKMNERRREIAQIYDDAFKTLKEYIDIPEIKQGVKLSRHNYTIKLKNKDREDLIEFLKTKNISSGVHYKPLYFHPRYSKFNKYDTPVTEDVWRKLIVLPLYPDLKNEEVENIIQNVKEFVTQNGTPSPKAYGVQR